MMICRQSFVDMFVSHNYETRTINQTPVLIQAFTIQTPTVFVWLAIYPEDLTNRAGTKSSFKLNGQMSTRLC